MSSLRSLVRRLSVAFDRDVQWSFSQEGEDRVLLSLFEGVQRGRYVDVGAHHPSRYSNTRLLYERGWSGLNIDPLPGTCRAFERARPRDVTLECGVAEQAGSATFYRFVEPALSTFDPQLASQRREEGWPLAGTETIELAPLSDLVRKHLGEGPVELLTIDVEGLDLQVLRSADLSGVGYQVICVEELVGALTESGPVHEFVSAHGYELCAATGRSRFYRLR